MSDQSSRSNVVNEVMCPRCWQKTDRVHSFEAPRVFFLLGYVAWTYEQVAGCPRCVQSRLMKLTWLSLPTSNLLFPLIGPWLLVGVVRSHLNEKHAEIPPQYADWANLTPPSPSESTNDKHSSLRLIGALLFAVIMVVVVFWVLPDLIG